MKTGKSPRVLLVLLALAAAAPAQEEEDEFEGFHPPMTVIVDSLRIREEPTVEAKVVGTLHLGDTVLFSNTWGDWARIKAPDGTVGWSCVELGGETFMVEYSYISFSGSLTDAAGDPVAGALVELVGSGESYLTDENGWFESLKTPRGVWDLRVTVAGRTALLENGATIQVEYLEKTHTFTLDTEYRLTLVTEELGGIAKPNIYIYPIEEAVVTVRLAFPTGGGITVSDPPYGDGWTVAVTPEGLIDGEHTFLFYEARGGGRVQREAGWVVARGELEGFFRKNLAATGFYPHEIEDFCEFWVPRLDDKPFFALYPQYDEAYDGLVHLEVEPEPWTVIRLAYLIEGSEERFELMPAAIPAHEVGGFTVHEWGVILGPADMAAYIY